MPDTKQKDDLIAKAKQKIKSKPEMKAGHGSDYAYYPTGVSPDYRLPADRDPEDYGHYLFFPPGGEKNKKGERYMEPMQIKGNKRSGRDIPGAKVAKAVLKLLKITK